MISAINASASDYQNSIVGLISSASNNRLYQGAPNPPLALRPDTSDEVALSEPGALVDHGSFRQRTALSIRSQLRVDQTGDGQMRATLHSKLRFQYQFEAADGTKIRIRVKANLHYSQTVGGDEASQSLRLRVKARVTVAQQGIASGATSLRETPGLPAEVLDTISEAFELFQQVTDAATSQFLEGAQNGAENGAPLDGDQLIGALVDAFNALTGTIDPALEPAVANLPDVSSGEVVEPIETPEIDASEERLTGSTIPESGAAIASVVASPVESLGQDVAPVQDPIPDREDPNGVGNESVEVSALEPAVGGELVAVDESDGAQSIAPSTAQQASMSVASIKLRMRFQFIQSLTSIVGDFGSDSSSLLVSQSALRLSVDMAARYSLPAIGTSDTVPQGQEVDAHV